MIFKRNTLKQHITPDQLNELSEEGKERLKKWWYDLGRGQRILTDTVQWNQPATNDPESNLVNPSELPLLSIGQMIEFIYDDFQRELHIMKLRKDWYVFTNDKWHEEELCDVLWAVVKEVLDD